MVTFKEIARERRVPYIDLFDVRKCIDSEIERADIRDKSTRTIVVIVFFLYSFDYKKFFLF